MTNIDEQIAKAKMEKRTIEEMKKIEEAKAEEKSKKISLDEVVSGIKEGKVTIDDVTFKFKNYKYLNGKIELPMPVGYFREVINTEKNVSLVNDLYGISFTAAYLDKVLNTPTLESFKKGIEENIKNNGFSVEWLEDGEIGEKDKLYYATYKTPTGRGPLFNVIFYRFFRGTCVIGNYNSSYKNIEKWEYLIKATLNFIKTK